MQFNRRFRWEQNVDADDFNPDSLSKVTPIPPAAVPGVEEPQPPKVPGRAEAVPVQAKAEAPTEGQVC